MPLTPLLKQPDIYADFENNLDANPITDDVALLKNERAVKQSIKNLVFTDRGERLFQPNIGCDVRNLLFDNFTQHTVIVAKELIAETINNYEPRANLIAVDIHGNADTNTININIVFNILNREEPVELTVVLTKVR